MILNLYCKCGAGAEGEIDPKGEARFREVWDRAHSGEGHGPCTQQDAIQAYQEQNNGEMPLGHD